MQKKIFKKPAYPSSYFSNKIWVKCPKCKGRGIVTTELGRYIVPEPISCASKYVCFNCNFRNKTSGVNKDYLYLGVIDKPCGNCNEEILRVTSPKSSSDTYSYETIECRNCQKVYDYKLAWYHHVEKRQTDPYFKYELLLKTSIKSEVLWFYNLTHLRYIKEYVEAEIREDNGRHKYSLIANLPKFVGQSKNRKLISNKLEKLQAEYSHIES